MTAIASYIQQFVGVPVRHERMPMVVNALRMLYEGGLLRGLLVAWIGAAILVYLIAVYSVFGLSVTLSKNGAVVKVLTESNTIIKLNLDQKRTGFARDNQDILESMQKIAEIRYLVPADTAVSRADIFDQNQ